MEELLLDPPPDQLTVSDTDDADLTITEAVVPYGVDTGMDPAAAALRALAGRLQDAADAGKPRAVHAVQVTYERDPFPMVYATMVHGQMPTRT